MKESKSVTKDTICGMNMDEQPLSTLNAMKRHSIFAATIVVKSFCSRPPVLMGAPGLAPFDTMTRQAGRWMLGYQFMFEKMDSNLVKTDDISEEIILERFFATPTDMTMQMHMVMVMYAPTDKLTLMVMLPYIRKEMDHLPVDGMRFVERAEGTGDIELRGMYSIYDFETNDRRHRLLLNGGTGVPSGSVGSWNFDDTFTRRKINGTY